MPKTIAAAATAHVLAHGPCTTEDVYLALYADRVTTARTDSAVRSALQSSRVAVELPDGRWDARTRVLTGCVLTVRARSGLADGVLWVHDDLAPLEVMLDVGPLPLRSGGSTAVGRGRVRTLVGPKGWLPEVAPGGLLGVRWDGTALDVEPVAETVPDDELAAVREVLTRHRKALSHSRSRGRLEITVDTAEVVLSALCEVPDLLARPLPPLSEVMALTTWPAAQGAWELPDGAWGKPETEAIELRLPPRVVVELRRRADLLGEHVVEHASILLAAAVDRVGQRERLKGDEHRYRDHDYWESDYAFGNGAENVLRLR